MDIPVVTLTNWALGRKIVEQCLILSDSGSSSSLSHPPTNHYHGKNLVRTPLKAASVPGTFLDQCICIDPGIGNPGLDI